MKHCKLNLKTRSKPSHLYHTNLFLNQCTLTVNIALYPNNDILYLRVIHYANELYIKYTIFLIFKNIIYLSLINNRRDWCLLDFKSFLIQNVMTKSLFKNMD